MERGCLPFERTAALKLYSGIIFVYSVVLAHYLKWWPPTGKGDSINRLLFTSLRRYLFYGPCQ